MRLLKLTDDQCKLIPSDLLTQEPDFAECVSYHAKKQDPALNVYRDAAGNDDIEVDDNAIVSKGDDNGAYVMAWVWVSDEDAGIEHCDKCDAVLPEAGDGYDGLCAECADEVLK